MLQDLVVARLAADPAFARDHELRAVLGRGGMALVARALPAGAPVAALAAAMETEGGL